MREGILLRIQDSSGRTAFGEVAPLPEFGSETLRDAIGFMDALASIHTRQHLNQQLEAIPPASAFALWSALQFLDNKRSPPGCDPATSGVFALGSNWEESLAHCRDSGVARFKIKIGIDSREKERALLEDLLGGLLQHEQIRLDPNMSLDHPGLAEWSKWLADRTDKVEYIEEPLQPSLVNARQLTQQAAAGPIPLALDESLSRSGLMPWLQAGWSGYWIIKPSILGIPHWMQQLDPDKVVLSSVFETGIGMNAIRSLAGAYSSTCHGLGTGAYFNDGLSPVPQDGRIPAFLDAEIENVWKTLSQLS